MVQLADIKHAQIQSLTDRRISDMINKGNNSWLT